MTYKQMAGMGMIVIVLLCTVLGVGGIWGFVGSDVAWQCFYTSVVVAIGLSVATSMVDVYFSEKSDVIKYFFLSAKKDSEEKASK